MPAVQEGITLLVPKQSKVGVVWCRKGIQFRPLNRRDAKRIKEVGSALRI